MAENLVVNSGLFSAPESDSNGIGSIWMRSNFMKGVYTGLDPEVLAFTGDRIHVDVMNFKQPSCKPSVSFLIRSFEILQSNRLGVSSLIPFFEMSKNPFSLIASLPIVIVWIRSHPFTRDLFGIGSKGIADPNGFGSAESRVNAKPIRYSLGTDPFGFHLV